MKVNVMQVITYDLNEIKDSLAELNNIDISEVKDYEVRDMLAYFISEDFNGNGEIIIQDEDGEDYEIL